MRVNNEDYYMSRKVIKWAKFNRCRLDRLYFSGHVTGPRQTFGFVITSKFTKLKKNKCREKRGDKVGQFFTDDLDNGFGSIMYMSKYRLQVKQVFIEDKLHQRF